MEDSEDEFGSKDLVKKIESGVDDTKELRLNVQNLVDPKDSDIAPNGYSGYRKRYRLPHS